MAVLCQVPTAPTLVSQTHSDGRAAMALLTNLAVRY